MSRYTIIGAGQAGLHLALGLLDRDDDVTLISDRTPEQYLAMPAMSSHTLQRSAIEREAKAGASLEGEVVANPAVGLDFSLTVDGREPVLKFQGDFAGPAQAIDSRLKNALLLRRVEARGGNVEYREATVAVLEAHVEAGRTVFMATGKGDLRHLFELDEERTVHDEPQRKVTLVMVRGLRPPRPDQAQRVTFLAHPELGEVFWAPNVHFTNEPIYACLVEAKPGSAMDFETAIKAPPDALPFLRRAIEMVAPWEAETLATARIADERGWLQGAVRPLVRRPVGRLPSGRPVFGVGDVLTVHDPVAGLGGNCAVFGVDSLLSGIEELGEAQLTPDWYESWFEGFWEEDAKYFVAFANRLMEPPGEPMQALLGASMESRSVADRLVGNWSRPRGFWPHIETIEAARQFIAEAAGEPLGSASHG